MKRFYFILALSVLPAFCAISQQVKSPDEFLGYKLGTTFTWHHQASSYVKYVAETSPYAEYMSYGRTYEGRELGVCFVSSPENLKNLEVLRKVNLAKTGLSEENTEGTQVPIIWLSYNVHGNESVGMEAALKTLYTLVENKYDGTEEWLKSCIIIIDPCSNPDGRDRYANQYRMLQPLTLNVDPNSWERSQGWPGSRSNHYFFDLNRDWTWQTQTETQLRLKLYNSFMPHVHADFHEMGASSNFFFAPGADPWHEVITPWQREFHKLMGVGNADLFDEKFRLYYTKESFDLFCPSFGDTWPLFNGAMGFTYEQAGGGGAGVGMERSIGDSITLEHRIEGHFLASIATIKVSYENRVKLMEGFNKYFETARTNPPFDYKSVIIKGSNETSAVKALLELLDKNQIRYSYAGNTGKKFKAFEYLKDKEGEVTIEKGDILVSAFQPQGHLVKVLFEPESKASDSITYDLSAWALPYLYNLNTFALKDKIDAANGSVEFAKPVNNISEEKPYAYLVNWNGFDEMRFLTALYKRDIRIRSAVKEFTSGTNKFNRGSLIIARGDNTHIPSTFDSLVMEAADYAGIKLHTASTGIVEAGKDFGSGYSSPRKAPKIAMLGGEGTSAGSVGEIWYFFERELEYPLTIINASSAASADLTKYDVLILTSGSYTRYKDPIMAFLQKGGKVLALDAATSLFSAEKTTALGKGADLRSTELKAKEKKQRSDDPELLKIFEDERRHTLSTRSSGAIYRVKLDTTHPYTFGMGNEWFIMKRSSGLPYLNGGSNIGYITESAPVSGFAGYKFQENIKSTLVIGSERVGRGEVVYVTDNPYFRAFWKSGRILVGNILLK
ncbi:MAG: M14 family zinc carboxypeptidase [Bacteroidales bacterium]